jgi:hypothetical protein
MIDFILAGLGAGLFAFLMLFVISFVILTITTGLIRLFLMVYRRIFGNKEQKFQGMTA